MSERQRWKFVARRVDAHGDFYEWIKADESGLLMRLRCVYRVADFWAKP